MVEDDSLRRLLSGIGVPVERRFVSAGGVRTHCLSAGAGRPVLLLHGGGGVAIGWYPVIGPLARRFQVIAPDMVGHGLSEKPSAPYDRPYFSAWLANLLDAWGLEAATIVAHSTGGAVAVQFALDHPTRVDRLVLANAVGLGSGARVPLSLMAFMMWQNFFPTRAGGRRFLERWALYDPHRLDEPMLWVDDQERRAVRSPGGRRFFWLGRGRALVPFRPEELGRLRQPTLIVWGEADRNYPLAQAEAAQRLMPNARLHVIAEAGHLCFREQPEAFNAALLAFLTDRHGDADAGAKPKEMKT